MAGELGLDLDLDACPDLAALPQDVALFSESNGRFIVTIEARHAGAFERLFTGLPCRRIGTVTQAAYLRAVLGGRLRIDLPIAALKAAYKEPLAHA
jgi:phosphoribosylformylglycinamidine synthase